MDGAKREAGRRIGAVVLVSLSLGAIVLAIGAPGLGWVLSGGVLIVASMCARWIGRTWVAACLASTIVLLLSFGPFGYDSAPTWDVDWAQAAFIFGPVIVGIAALLMPFRRPGAG